MAKEYKEDKFLRFIEDKLIIRSKNKSLCRFFPNKEQGIIINKIVKQIKDKQKVRLIILKGRQTGISTLASARSYYNITFNRGYRGFVLAHRQSATNNLFDITNRYITNNLDKKEKLSIKRNKEIRLKEQDSSIVFATAGSMEVGRSDTIQFFHGSEVAYWRYEDNHLSSILMAVPDSSGSEIILESTSNGPSGMFYNMVNDAHKNNSEFELIFLPWFLQEDYRVDDTFPLPRSWIDYGKQYKLEDSQIRWAYLRNKLLSFEGNYDESPSNRFLREFPASIAEAFKVGNKNMLINLEDVTKIAYDKSFFKSEALVKEEQFKSLKNKYLEKNKHPIILGVDVARGGGDLSWIIDKQANFLGFNINQKLNLTNTMELVGIIVNHIEKLNPAFVCLDAGGGGVGVYDRLKELGYGKILVLVHFASKANNEQKYLNKRAEIWGNLRDFIVSEDSIIINDSLLIKQIVSVEYTYTSKGQIQLESKEEIKRKLKQSPDGGDACALTFAVQNKSFYGENSVGYYEKSLERFNPFQW